MEMASGLTVGLSLGSKIGQSAALGMRMRILEDIDVDGIIILNMF